MRVAWPDDFPWLTRLLHHIYAFSDTLLLPHQFNEPMPTVKIPYLDGPVNLGMMAGQREPHRRVAAWNNLHIGKANL